MQCDGTGRTARTERSGSFRSIDSASVVYRERAVEAYPDQKVTLLRAQPCSIVLMAGLTADGSLGGSQGQQLAQRPDVVATTNSREITNRTRRDVH